jgi:hypothetical protein
MRVRKQFIILGTHPPIFTTNKLKIPKLCATFFFMARPLEKPHEKRKKKLPYYSREMVVHTNSKYHST